MLFIFSPISSRIWARTWNRFHILRIHSYTLEFLQRSFGMSFFSGIWSHSHEEGNRYLALLLALAPRSLYRWRLASGRNLSLKISSKLLFRLEWSYARELACAQRMVYARKMACARMMVFAKMLSFAKLQAYIRMMAYVRMRVYVRMRASARMKAFAIGLAYINMMVCVQLMMAFARVLLAYFEKLVFGLAFQLLFSEVVDLLVGLVGVAWTWEQGYWLVGGKRLALITQMFALLVHWSPEEVDRWEVEILKLFVD